MAIPIWEALTTYPLGSRVLDPSYHIQRVVGGKSGSSTPSWNDAGGNTSDGSLIWTDRGVGAWAANTVMALGTPILDPNGHIQKVVGGVSGPSTPAWDNTPTGATSDGSLVWSFSGSIDDTWSPSTPMTLGRKIYSLCPNILPYLSLQGNWWLYLQQVVGGRAGTTAPSWNDSGGTTADGSLIWTDQGLGSGPPAWQASAYPYTVSTSSYYSIGDEVLDSNGHIQKVTGLNGAATGAGEPDWGDVVAQYDVHGLLVLPVGTLSYDGSLVWRNEGLYASYVGGVLWVGSGPTTWLANTCYAVGSAISEGAGGLGISVNAQTVTSLNGAKTGGTAPAWNEGGFTKDNSVMWYDQGGVSPTWLGDHYYLVGATIVDPSGHLQQVTALNDATSGSSDPTWDDEGGNTYDGTVTWQDEGGNPPSRTTQTVVEAASTLSIRTGRTTQLNAQAAIWWTPRTARQTQLAQQTAVWWLPRTARQTQLVILLAKSLIKVSSAVKPFLYIPNGEGQTVDELSGSSSISEHEITCIDPNGDLKALIASNNPQGCLAYLLQGFPGMSLSDFATLETLQISKTGFDADGKVTFSVQDPQRFLKKYIWTEGGPSPWEPGNPAPVAPLGACCASNGQPISDANPRYVQGNPLDLLLVALQNELGIGQTATPWKLFVPGDDDTLINPNPFIDVPSVLALRDGQFNGDWCEFVLKSQETGKDWVESQILRPFGLHWVAHYNGLLSLKSMKSPDVTNAWTWNDHSVKGIPVLDRRDVLNTVEVRFDTNDAGLPTAARAFNGQVEYQDDASVATYNQQLIQQLELTGLRARRGAFARALIYSDRVFRRHASAPPVYEVKTQLRNEAAELGNFVLFSHRLVPDLATSTGARGITNVLCEIVDRQPDWESAEVTCKLLDTRFVGLTLPFKIAPDATPVWASASGTEKGKYLFISSDDGKNADGSAANTIF